MKKLIFSFCMVMLVSTMATFSQMTNPEVYRIINQSKELNKDVTSNPDSIWPGQRLSFLFEDGYIRDWVVQKGETETSIVKEISRLEISHGRVVAPEDTTAVDTADVKPEPVEPSSVPEDDFPYWTLLGILCIILFLYFLLRFLTKGKKEIKTTEYVDPTKEGAPFVYGGVKPENAESHFHSLTSRNTEESNIVIRGIRPVFISTKSGLPQIVEFADRTSKELSFRNFPGFAGLVSRDKGKNFTEEYFLEGCGNPVYRKQSFLAGDGLIISETPIKFGDEEVVEESKTSEEVKVSETTEEKPVLEVVSEEIVSEEKVKNLTPVDQKKEVSDVRAISSEHTLLAENFLKTQNAYEVVMKVTTDPNGASTVETTLKTNKNVPTEKPKKEDEK